jgi:hypothetical protein
VFGIENAPLTGDDSVADDHANQTPEQQRAAAQAIHQEHYNDGHGYIDGAGLGGRENGG